MRFFSVVDREMRAAARRRATYYVRWLTALGFFILFLWLMWVMDGLTNRRAATEILQVFSGFTFFYCLVIGAVRTADCISAERRDGTLGLLYLTNLNSAEIVVGKLCSHACASAYGLLAIFPILALPLLLGGITGGEFTQTLLALLTAILASLVAGLVASVLFARQFTAVAAAMGLVTIWSGGMLGVAAIVHEYKGPPLIVEWCATASPLYALLTASGTRFFGANLFWQSFTTVTVLSLLGVLWVTWRLARSWRDQPVVAARRGGWKFWQRRPGQPSASAVQLRQRLLDVHPFYWLAGRRLVSAPFFMILTLVLVTVTVYVTVPVFQNLMRREEYAAMLGSLLGWVWTVLGLHVVVLYYAAMVGSQRLAEDKQTGALEMILCTPTTERSIARGLWRAFFRRMAFPVGAVVLLHGLFIWQCLLMCELEPPGDESLRGTTATEYFRAILWNEPIRGRLLDWEFTLMMRIVIFLLPGALWIWITLGCVGRWLGLKMKHPGFAPLVALALTFVPAILIFSIACYIAEESNLLKMPDRQLVPLVALCAFAWGFVYCASLCWWATGNLRSQFRHTVTSHFQPPSDRRWWWSVGRTLWRFSLRTAAAGAVIALLLWGYLSYQKWSAQHSWTRFQAELRQRGEATTFPLPQPAPVADAENFARIPAFERAVRARPRGTSPFAQMIALDNSYQRWTADATFPWSAQKPFTLDQFIRWFDAGKKAGATNRAAIAGVYLQILTTYQHLLRDLAAGAGRPFYQPVTNCNVETVIRADTPEGYVLERAHFLLATRASALLTVGDPAAAAQDVRTGLQLARLARQSLDARAAMRQQALLLRTLQPIWEGLHAHQWTAEDLLAFEAQLGQFTLLADHTNDVRRVVQAYLQLWSRFPDLKVSARTTPISAENGYRSHAQWRHEPDGWWYNRCRQLYAAGENAIARVNVAEGWVQFDNHWSDLEDVPLNDDADALVEQYHWGNPHPTFVAFAQAALQQARLACALERHWLANHQYPEKLTLLVPEYLPRLLDDPTTRRPMAYEVTTNGYYTLRSFGSDGNDDRKTGGSGDWLWSYPTNQPAASSGK